ncbi:MAG TPA: alpha/beta hydrolase, partial [Myxococcota bacterium]|nr:alpha/beta hydrolase [Myxococcota bacterium]
VRERVHDELRGHVPATVVQAMDALTRFSSHDWIGSVDVPTAVVVTARDDLVPAARQRKLAASVPGAEVFEVAGDHDACVSHPSFAPTLVRACLSVARRAGLFDAAKRSSGAVRRS